MDNQAKKRNAINQIRIKLYDICGDYRQIIQSIYRSPNISQKHNMEYLDEQTSDTVEKALKLLKPKQKIDPVSEQQAKLFILTISKYQNEIQYLLNELKRRKLTFNASMNENKRVFQQTIDHYYDKYSHDRQNEIQKHSKIIQKLKDELQDLRDNFETRLKSQIGIIIYEKDQLYDQFNTLTKKFNEIRSNFESDIQKSEQKSDQLTKELKELEESNAVFLRNIENDYSNQMKSAQQKVSEKIHELEKTNETLKAELKEKTANHEVQISEIQAKISEKTKESEQDLETKIKNKQNELDSKLNDYEEAQKRIEDELMKKYNEQKSLNSKTIENLQSILTSLNNQINEIESTSSKKLEIIQEQNEKRVKEKEREIQSFFADQKREIDDFRHKNEAEIQFNSKRNDQLYSKIEKELIDCANNLHKNKMFLESQLNNLIQTKNELELKIFEKTKPIEKFSFQNTTIADITSQENNVSSINLSNIEEIAQQFERFDSISTQKLLELRDLKLSKKNELANYRKESNDLIQHEEGISIAISDEINSKTLRFEKNQAKIKELLKSHENEEKKLRKEFKTKIKMQKDVIRQCNEELQRLKIDDLKKEQLSLCQADHRKNVKKLMDEINTLKNQLKFDVDNIQEKMEIEIKNERFENQKRIVEAQDKLIDVLKKLSIEKLNCIDDCEKDQQKWSELRSDIANSNLKVFSNLVSKSNTNSRPGSSFTRNCLSPLKIIK